MCGLFFSVMTTIMPCWVWRLKKLACLLLRLCSSGLYTSCNGLKIMQPFMKRSGWQMALPQRIR